MKRLCFLLVLLTFVACSRQKPVVMPDEHDTYSPTQRTCYAIADRLADQLRMKNIKTLKIIKVTFVNIDNVNQSSTSGRSYAEYISTRLCQLGYKVLELKIRARDIKIKPYTGELLLSYQQKALAKKYDASAALIGYYKTQRFWNYEQDVSIFARIIDINDNTLLAAEDVSTR